MEPDFLAGPVYRPNGELYSYPKTMEEYYNPIIVGNTRKYGVAESYDASGKCLFCIVFEDNRAMLDHADSVQRNIDDARRYIKERSEERMRMGRQTIQPQYYQPYQPQPNPQNLPSVHVRQPGIFRRMMKRVMPRLLE